MGSLNQIAAAGGETVVKDPRETEASIEANYYQRFSFPLRVQKPLIAAINGPAAGLGFILPLYCDIRFASDQARFGTAFAKLALIAEHGVSWLLPRAVGMGNAFDLLYSARIIDAHEALRMGYLQRVIPHDELIPQTLAYVESFAKSSSPEAMRVSRKLVWDGMFQALAHDDFKEGLQAFGEKRPPVYRGLSVQSRV
jgi:enoyl-CoA hydratase/carnithine racemase